jgi:hypothetical protein
VVLEQPAAVQPLPEQLVAVPHPRLVVPEAISSLPSLPSETLPPEVLQQPGAEEQPAAEHQEPYPFRYQLKQTAAVPHPRLVVPEAISSLPLRPLSLPSLPSLPSETLPPEVLQQPGAAEQSAAEHQEPYPFLYQLEQGAAV